MPLSNDKGLIEPEQLQRLLDNNTDNIRLVDGTYRAGYNGQDPALFFENNRIGNAVPFDIDAIADMSAPLAHTTPSPDSFASSVSELGINNSDLLIVYDQNGMSMAASRVWWMFKLFGHDNVWVLNGGLPAWTNEGHPLDNTAYKAPDKGTFAVSAYNKDLLSDKKTIIDAQNDHNQIILDARSEERFGTTSCDAGCQTDTGHIPHSRNIPFPDLIDPQTKKMKSPDFLKKAFAEHLDTPSKKAVFTCGSGVTACILALAAYELEHKNFSVYDGSWTEWQAFPV